MTPRGWLEPRGVDAGGTRAVAGGAGEERMYTVAVGRASHDGQEG